VGHDQRERPAFLEVGGERIFSVLHRPSTEPRGGFLFCHAFAEEKLWAHRVYVSYARRLASQGWTVLRIDFRGEGDSDRAFEQTDVDTRLEDIRAALDVLRAELPPGAPLGLLGLRLGATLAAKAASERDSGVTRLILWDPVVKGGPYMQSVLLVNLAYQMALHKKVVEDRKVLVERLQGGGTVNIEGYALSGSFFQQASALDLVEMLSRFRGQGLVVQIGPEDGPVRRELADLATGNERLALRRAAEEPFWKEIKTFYQRAERLAGVTDRWLEEQE
jgi:exosortase A-associated hydrolase 2